MNKIDNFKDFIWCCCLNCLLNKVFFEKLTITNNDKQYFDKNNLENCQKVCYKCYRIYMCDG